MWGPGHLVAKGAHYTRVQGLGFTAEFATAHAPSNPTTRTAVLKLLLFAPLLAQVYTQNAFFLACGVASSLIDVHSS